MSAGTEGHVGKGAYHAAAGVAVAAIEVNTSVFQSVMECKCVGWMQLEALTVFGLWNFENKADPAAVARVHCCGDIAVRVPVGFGAQ